MSGLMQLLGGHQAQPEIAGSVVQTSIYGLPIPVVYGRARIGGNLIHLPHDPVKTNAQSSKLGKGATQEIYTAPVAIGLAEGVTAGLGGILRAWADKDLVASFATYMTAGWSFFNGGATQVPWSYLTTNLPAQALAYQALCYVAHPALDLPGYHLRNYSFELLGLMPFAGPNSIADASPRDVLVDILTDVMHGFGWIPFGSAGSLIGDLTVYGQYCAAAGLFVSPAYTTQKSTVAHLQDLCDASNSAIVWSDGTLKVIPFGDTALTGNGQTYTPNTTPLYDLTDVDFIAAPGTDPVKVTRKPNVDAYNQIFVEFEDRANEYNPSTAEAKDQASIEAIAAAQGDIGVRPAPKIALSLIKDAGVARTVAQLRLQREQNVRNLYKFSVGLRFSLLEPMDLVTLTDPNMGLNLTPVRIAEVTEKSDEQGIDIVAEDWPFGTASATLYPVASGNGYSPQATIAPGTTTTPVIFNGPAPLSASPLEIWIAANGGPVWGGCDIWFSTDNSAFHKVGRVTAKGIFGTLTSALATNAPLPATDTTHTLAVDLTPSLGTLVSVSATDFAALTSLCYVDGEFLAYQTAALTSANHYNLTTLGRGAYGSPIAASHAIGSSFVLCDERVFRLAFPQGSAGQVVYFKFPAFNQYGGALEDIAAVTSQAFTIGSIPSIGVGPSLVVTPTAGTTTVSIAYTPSSGVLLSINGGTYSAAPASPIIVTRPAAGSADLEYTFMLTAGGQTVTDGVTVTALDRDTATPDLTITPGATTAGTVDFAATASNPQAGGPAPTITVTLKGTLGSSPGPVSYADGSTTTIPSGTNITFARPAFGTGLGVQATVTFRASISGGGAETISRTVLNQVQDSFGPTLIVTPSFSGTFGTIVWSSTGTVTLSIDGGAFSSPPASPISVTRPAVKDPPITYTFKCVKDSETITAVVVVTPRVVVFTSVTATPNYGANTVTVGWASTGIALFGYYEIWETAPFGSQPRLVGTSPYTATAFTYTPSVTLVAGGSPENFSYYIRVINASGWTEEGQSSLLTVVFTT